MDKNQPFHAKVRDELRAIPVPADLRDRILARDPEGKTITRSVQWRQKLALAAGIAVLGTGVFLWQRNPSEDRTFAGFQSRMTGYAVRQYSMDFFTKNLEDARARLSSAGAPADFQLPAPLQTAPVKGGAKLTWQGQPVSMVCFEGPDQKTLYLFIVESTSLPATPDKVQIQPSKGLASASWSRAGKTYLLAADLPVDNLRPFALN